MKNLKHLLFTAAVLATLSLAYSAGAQGKASFGDRLVASPKAREMINERVAGKRANAALPFAVVTYRTAALEGIAASPRVRQILAEKKVVLSVAPYTEVASGTPRWSGADDKTASPNWPAQPDQSSAPVILAPRRSAASGRCPAVPNYLIFRVEPAAIA